MPDRNEQTDKPKPDESKPAPAADAEPKPARLDWQRLVAGIVILLVSLFLLVAQATAPAGADTSLLSGPAGQALNIGGIVAGAWVIWSAIRRQA